MFREVLVERADGVMTVTINRPEARNAVNLPVHMGIGNALEEADSDPGVRVVVITGAGSQAFCAGADLKALARGESLLPEDRAHRGWGFAGFVSHPISKPIIAAVNGYALGGGTEIALASDMIVASRDAMFGLPEVTRGIIASAGGAFRLGQQLPTKLAMELLLTGQRFTAKRAQELGLVNSVCAPEDLMRNANALAERIAANAPLAVQASKRIARGIADGRIESDDHAWAINRREQSMIMKTADASEGPRAFAEKRQPTWQSR